MASPGVGREPGGPLYGLFEARRGPDPTPAPARLQGRRGDRRRGLTRGRARRAGTGRRTPGGARSWPPAGRICDPC